MSTLRDEITKAPVGIKCDYPHCQTLAPPAAEIQAANGLINMGWRCTGGTHYCPVHAT